MVYGLAAEEMRALLMSFIVLHALLQVESRKKKDGGWVVRMEYYGNCPMDAAERETLSYFSESGTKNYDRTTVGWGIINYTRPVKAYTKAVVKITKCTDRGDPNCEEWQQWRFEGPVCCLNLQLTNMLWSPLFLSEPRMSCPHSEGLYKYDNVTLDIEKLKLVGFRETLFLAYWKVRMEFDADYSRILNVCFESQGIRLRAKN